MAWYNWKKKQKISTSTTDLTGKLEDFKTDLLADRIQFNNRVDEVNEFEEKLFNALYEKTQFDAELKNLFHRLNYQRAVDELSGSIKKWKITLGIMTAGLLVGLYFVSTKFDSIVPSGKNGILGDYERMISAIDLEVNWQKHGHAMYAKDGNKVIDSTFVELAVDSISQRSIPPNLTPLITATDSFWTVYYIRYLLVRLFISVVVFLFITAAVKVYMRLRRDKMSLIYREEATTAILYFIEKYLTTKDENDNNIVNSRDKDRIMQLMPLIAGELYNNPDSKHQSKDDHQTIVIRLMQMMENIVSLKTGEKKP